MRLLDLLEIAKIVGGEVFAPKELLQKKIANVVIDSRNIHRGENLLFFALKGAINNGHNYVPELIEKGVKSYVVSDRSVITGEAAFILVENTSAALQKLAAYNRKQYTFPVLGITGSNGKTIVKEWLYELLSNDFRVVRSPKSYNSQVGVPLSVLLMDANFDLGIFEAGISQPGEMQNLEPVIAPEIGILTNIGDAHQEFFVSRGQKIDEKLLLFQNCKQLICRIDDEEITKKVNSFCTNNGIMLVSWGTNAPKADLKITTESQGKITEITALFQDKKYRFNIPFSDKSAIENACHCFATIVALELNPENYLKRFEVLQPVAMRLEIKEGINRCILINDYYNSDLNSLAIALSVLDWQAESKQQEKVVILSAIEQTGIPLPQLYKKVNDLLTEWGINKLIGIGAAMSKHKELFTILAVFYNNTEDFQKRFQPHLFHSSAILLKGARHYEFEKISALLQQKAHQTVLEINLNALVHNLNIFRGLLEPGTKITVMVKAFSYGSGAVEIARLLQYQHVDYLAVAVSDEGVQLRNAGITLPIIVMNPEKESFTNMITYQLEPNIYSYELLKDFADSVAASGRQHYPVHLKIDTGMNRLGFKTTDQLNTVVQFLNRSHTLNVQSVFSHLVGSDDAAFDDFTHKQFQKFETACKFIANSLPYKFDRHILNSAGIERFSPKQYEMVRLGIGLYGISLTGLPLENISTLKSTVSLVKTVSKNETIGYSRKGILNHDSKIATVPIGYADGINRKLGNRNGCAFVNGKRVPIVGNICMDMLMLDVSGVDVAPGDRVEFFGSHIPVSESAEKIGTIPYEVLTGISQRVKRVYLQE